MSSNYINRLVERDTYLTVKGFALNEDDGESGVYVLALTADHYLVYSTLFVLVATPEKWRDAQADINQYIACYSD